MLYRKDKIHVRFEYDELFKPAEPQLSSKFIPDWFKALPKNQAHPQLGLRIEGTAKKCVPLLDAFGQGYVIPFPMDIMVFHEPLFACTAEGEDLGDGLIAAEVADRERHFGKALNVEKLGVGVAFKVETLPEKHSGFQPGQHHPWQVGTFGNNIFKFINPYCVHTSPGSSCRFTTPINRRDLPFRLMEGVVDTDTFKAPVNFPFEWLAGPTQEPIILEAGTPMAQVVPFKRVNITHSVEPIRNHTMQSYLSTMVTHIENTYRRKFWHKAKTNK